MEKAVVRSAIKRTIKSGIVKKGYEHINWWCNKYPHRNVILVNKWFKLWANRYLKGQTRNGF